MNDVEKLRNFLGEELTKHVELISENHVAFAIYDNVQRSIRNSHAINNGKFSGCTCIFPKWYDNGIRTNEEMDEGMELVMKTLACFLSSVSVIVDEKKNTASLTVIK